MMPAHLSHISLDFTMEAMNLVIDNLRNHGPQLRWDLTEKLMDAYPIWQTQETAMEEICKVLDYAIAVGVVTQEYVEGELCGYWQFSYGGPWAQSNG